MSFWKKVFPRQWRFGEQAYYTLTGWRFQDLKDYIDKKNVGATTLPDSGQQLLLMDAAIAARDHVYRDNAFVSAMPPAPTGVASCNLKTLVEGAADVDIFSHWKSIDEYAAFLSQASAANLNGYAIAAMPLFLARRRYKSLVFSFGNSNEDYFVVKAGATRSALQLSTTIGFHFHDACVWNVVGKVWEDQRIGFMDGVLQHYPDRDATRVREIFATYTARWQQVEALIGLKCYGMRVLIESGKPDIVFVNSQAARRMVCEDYGNDESPPDGVNIQVVFHPIFKSDVRVKALRQRTDGMSWRIGTFGVASDKKGLRILIAACHVLKDRGISTKLVLAGFNVSQYAEKNAALFLGLETEFHSDISDQALLDHMETVDLAVQLRLQNLGESSGVVASLIRKQVPMIVTGSGAFLEYERCAEMVPPDCTAADLANAIEKVLAGNARSAEAFDTYFGELTPARLCERWFAWEERHAVPAAISGP